MSKKQSQIRWRESDTAELQRTINNFNAKLYRVKKSHPEYADFLPERVTKSDLIKTIHTRADFNRITNSLKRFSKRGAEPPVKASRGAKSTKWEVGEFKRKVAIDNARRTRERNKLLEKEVKTRGRGTGETRARMGSIKENSLKPRKRNFKNMSQKEWELAKSNIDKAIDPLNSEFRKHNMRLNYIKGLRENGYSDDIVSLVLEMDIDKFIEVTQTDEEATFDFIYDPIEFKLKNEALFDVWKTASDNSK